MLTVDAPLSPPVAAVLKMPPVRVREPTPAGAVVKIPRPALAWTRPSKRAAPCDHNETLRFEPVAPGVSSFRTDTFVTVPAPPPMEGFWRYIVAKSVWVPALALLMIGL